MFEEKFIQMISQQMTKGADRKNVVLGTVISLAIGQRVEYRYPNFERIYISKTEDLDKPDRGYDYLVLCDVNISHVCYELEENCCCNLCNMQALINDTEQIVKHEMAGDQVMLYCKMKPEAKAEYEMWKKEGWKLDRIVDSKIEMFKKLYPDEVEAYEKYRVQQANKTQEGK